MVDINSMDREALEQLRDAVNRRLLEMRRTTGLALPELLQLFEEIKITLRDQGKDWWSLETWQWMEGGIRFWLNPKDQDLYSSGWFSIDELIAWAHDIGPVMIDYDEAEADATEAARPASADIAITWLPQTTEATESELPEEPLRLSR
ncbi:MAG TPA: hypothetical protein PKA05_00370 [Roseiflexaceae bacterium]|nr:hypothetical protein [Roseiflexaceae bacterium]HMP38810.1 hypothetical protein [Roseiflexaceae bacterium]